MDAMIVVTAAEALDAGFLGARFNDELIRRLKRIAATYRIHFVGEGGHESFPFIAEFYSRLLTYTTTEVWSAPDRLEPILGGFA
jgi:diphthamide synthase (EF-2-diphthine--ammonia ligase)